MEKSGKSAALPSTLW